MATLAPTSVLNGQNFTGQCYSTHSGDPTTYGVFVVITLVGGVLIQRFLNSYESLAAVPYSLMVLFFGMVQGGIHVGCGECLGWWSSSIEGWLNIDPHVLFYLFLPALLFAGCFAVEHYVFMRIIWQSIILAVFGVLISMVIFALVGVYVYPYGWSWTEALMFGAMFSATDPVATINLLKYLGAPHDAGVLIEGESLLNDGTAFVLFLAFEQSASGQTSPSAGTIVGSIVYASVIGPLMGALVAAVAVFLMAWIWRDVVLEMTVTVLAAWGSFYLGNLVNASGVLAVVTVGVLLAGYSISYVDSETFRALKAMWAVIDYVANTTLFGFAGLVIVDRFSRTDHIQAADFGWVIFFYVVVNASRYFANAVLWWPWLARTGLGMNWRKYVVVSWAGLRGAVGLIAALYTVAECHCPPVPAPGQVCLSARTASIMMFQMAGIVLLTLVVNGPTSKAVLRGVKLAKLTAAHLKLFNHSVAHMQRVGVAEVEAMGMDARFEGVDWTEVWRHMPVLHPEVMADFDSDHMRKRVDAEGRRLQTFKNVQFDAAESSHAKRVVEARRRYLNMVRNRYRAIYGEGSITSFPGLSTLIAAASRAEEFEASPLDEWAQSLSKQVFSPVTPDALPPGSSAGLVAWALRRYRMHRISVSFHAPR